jgi:protein TonB
MGYALLLAAALHAAIILGIGFTPEPHEREETPRQSLRVVVARPQSTPSEEPTQDAGAEAETEAPVAKPPPQEKTAAAPPPPVPHAEPQLPPEPEPAAPVEPAPAPKLTARHREEQVAVAEVTPASKPKPQKKPKPKPKPKAKPKPKKRITAAQLMASRSEEIMRLNEELERKSTAYANRPRRKAISASTTEYKYAAYLDAWRRKVERIGNLNYPDEARRKKLYGNLVLHVAVRADGSIADIRILHSSGAKVLDEAAIRIVKLSAPFAPFPRDIRAETDILDITRTWQFLSSNRLRWKK